MSSFNSKESSSVIMDSRPAKRQRTSTPDAQELRSKRAAFLSSLTRPVSPPSTDAKNIEYSDIKSTATSFESNATIPLIDIFSTNYPDAVRHHEQLSQGINPNISMVRGQFQEFSLPKTVESPFRLLRTRGVPSDDNNQTVSLHDILGDPLIKQAWVFNFCFDVNWTMKHFDSDVRDSVEVKIVHGSWRKEDRNRQQIQEHLQQWKNVKEIQAYLSDPFGTHHSKMMVLFKNDDTAQVIIHTANMLKRDWDDMTQAAWISPALPILQEIGETKRIGAVGSGQRFKYDILRYFRAYGSKLKVLTDQLSKHDFSKVQGALIASTPSYQKLSDPVAEAWGHLNLRHALRSVHRQKEKVKVPLPTRDPQHLVCQVSSIATLPADWLHETLYRAATPPLPTKTNFRMTSVPLTTSIVYPTPTDLQEALTGYTTGGSIHTKISKPAQLKQVESLHPQLRRWGKESSDILARAGRHNIPPHIKTYICFESEPTKRNPTPDIEWALLTSANLSQQAWGTIPKLPKADQNQKNAVSHVSSFEIGVLVWPELFLPPSSHGAITDEDSDSEAEEGTVAKPLTVVRMVPTFGTDTPGYPEVLDDDQPEPLVVGLRMPYDLPLAAYKRDEMPWSPGAVYAEPDRLGQTWGTSEVLAEIVTQKTESESRVKEKGTVTKTNDKTNPTGDLKSAV